MSRELETKKVNKPMTHKNSGKFSQRSIVLRALIACLAVAAMSDSPAAAKVYTLVSDSPWLDDSPYGFSGTITTDGSLGNISDVSLITDWNIKLETLVKGSLLTLPIKLAKAGAFCPLFGSLFSGIFSHARSEYRRCHTVI